MNVLGIDYGDSKIGLAFASGPLAEPLKVIHYTQIFQALEGIVKVVKQEKIEKIIVGVSEGSVANNAKTFANMLKLETGLPVELVDETLTTHDAQQKAIEAGMSVSKRKRLEDAFAATIILQSYLDNNQ